MQDSKRLLTTFAASIVTLSVLFSTAQAVAQQQDSVTDSWIVTSVFRNWSADRTRNVSMTVYFIANPGPPAGFQ